MDAVVVAIFFLFVNVQRGALAFDIIFGLFFILWKYNGKGNAHKATTTTAATDANDEHRKHCPNSC